MTYNSVPAIIRGEVVTSDLLPFGGRDGVAAFTAPDPTTIADRLPLADPGLMADVEAVSFEEILEYLHALGQRLVLGENAHLDRALTLSADFSDLTAPVLTFVYEQIAGLFNADVVREMADLTVGIPYLQGWVTRDLDDGRRASVRALGARTVHVIAGNSPLVSGLTVIRNAITRSDGIIKLPSNDPFTAGALAQTMIEMAPDHPLTKHLSVAYWRGGDTTIEETIYRPSHVEKIVAWGGFSSVQHIKRYLEPGLELVALDPKRSASIVGPEAFLDDDAFEDAAIRAAADIGSLNQVGCVNARVIYVATGDDDAGIARANAFGQRVYEQILDLPRQISTKPRRFDPELRANLDGVRASGADWFKVFGGREGEGAVVVSQMSEPVDFHRALNGRVANVVPIAAVPDAMRFINAYTQTIGVYPDTLAIELRDVLPRYGAQRIVSLGYATSLHSGLPQDAIEPVRRSVKWIVHEQSSPDRIAPMWTHADDVKVAV